MKDDKFGTRNLKFAANTINNSRLNNGIRLRWDEE